MARLSARLSWRRRPEALLHPLDPSVLALLKSLVTATKEIEVCSTSLVFQRANARYISRRITALSFFFEEVRDSGVWVPPSALASFKILRATFRNIKALICACRDSSNLLSLMEQESLAKQFLDLTQSIGTTLSELPYELLEVSKEVREQVNLVMSQASKAGLYIDPEEKQLQTEVASIMTEFERENSPDLDKLELILQRLQFNDATDCEKELFLLEKEKERLRSENQLENVPNINSLVSFVRYSRCVLYGLSSGEQIIISACKKYDVSASRKVVFAREENGSVSVPKDFMCPISLEIMVDPVTIASGQTYERSAIARWMQDGHNTCPKSGMKLLHTDFIPNCALRRLITQWCAENDFILEPAEKVDKANRIVELPNTKAAQEATKMTAEFLVEKLAKGTPEVQRQAAHELRLLAKDGTDNRECIAGAGAIPHLVALLLSADSKTQENVVTALLNLSIHDLNKSAIVDTEGALEAIVAVMWGSGATEGASMESRENAAAVLFSLSMVKEYRAAVGESPGAIAGLVKLVKEGRRRGRKDATATLCHIASRSENGAALISEGAIPALFTALGGEDADTLAADALSVLAILARRAESSDAISAGVGEITAKIVRLMADGSPRVGENGTAVLLAACSRAESGRASDLCRKLRQSPALIPTLQRILTGGAPRGQRKAASLLRLLQSSCA